MATVYNPVYPVYPVYHLKFGPFLNLHFRPSSIRSVIQESTKILPLNLLETLDKLGFSCQIRPSKSMSHEMKFQEQWIPFQCHLIFMQRGAESFDKEELQKISTVLKQQFQKMVGHTIDNDVLISELVLETCKDMRLAFHKFEDRIFRSSTFDRHIDIEVLQFETSSPLPESISRTKCLNEIEDHMSQMLKCMLHDFFDSSQIQWKKELVLYGVNLYPKDKIETVLTKIETVLTSLIDSDHFINTFHIVCKTDEEKKKFYLPSSLLSNIPYFQTLMESSFRESQTQASTFYVGHMMSGELLVQFICEGVLRDMQLETKSIFEELVNLADLLMFESLTKYLNLAFEYFEISQIC